MINLAELEYLNSCFNPEQPKDSTERILEGVIAVLRNTFKGFVVTVVDDHEDLYTATNLDTLEALQVINGSLDILEKED